MDSDQQQDIESISTIKQEIKTIKKMSNDLYALRDYALLVKAKEQRNKDVAPWKEKIYINAKENLRLEADKKSLSKKIEKYQKMNPFFKGICFFANLTNVDAYNYAQYDIETNLKSNEKYKEIIKKYNRIYENKWSGFIDKHLPTDVTLNEYLGHLSSLSDDVLLGKKNSTNEQEVVIESIEEIKTEGVQKRKFRPFNMIMKVREKVS